MITKNRLSETREMSKGQAALYATGADFCRIFHEDMTNLYLLSLLLTADSEKAEQCFVSGLDDCATGNQVFKEWARSWARRTIIKSAIRFVAPESGATGQDSNAAVANVSRDQVQPELRAELAAVLALQPFERFAFVMSVLEGYSDRECTLLLGCTRETLVAARSRALQQIGSGRQADVTLQAKPLPENRNSVLGLNMQARLASPA